MPEFLHVLFILVEKHSPVFFLTEMLLFGFVAFIAHASIFCLYRGMVYYLIEKHKQKFRQF